MTESARTFEITLTGCDDSTVVEMELTHDEWTVVDRLAHRTQQASENGCQPRMTVARKDGGEG